VSAQAVAGSVQAAAPSRSEVEDFLYWEAELLNAWRLDDWLALFEEGAEYLVPTFDRPDGDPLTTQFFIADDWELLKQRVKRLKSRHAHAENPRSTTHRMITNVRIAEANGETLRVHASFFVQRIRDGQIDPYFGTYDHTLVIRPEGLRFRVRRAVLNLERLRPASRLSIIL